jgi:trehalose 6-phosphate phosphatase
LKQAGLSLASPGFPGLLKQAAFPGFGVSGHCFEIRLSKPGQDRNFKHLAVRPPPPPSITDALFLDFDGTLVELAERPSPVQVPPDLPALLACAAAAVGEALAIVSGRRLASIDALLTPMRFSGAGLHGAELRTDPRETAPPLESALDGAGQWLAARIDGDTALWLEDKGAALALHYRGAPQRADDAERLLRDAVAGLEVEVIAGKYVFEARPRGVDKGGAVRALMQRPPFTGRRPIYVGDDATDEDGINAAQSLGGVGIKVGDGGSAAAFHLENPVAVRVWLAAVVKPAQVAAEERPQI